jgi:methionine-rich copper-binding protein CopC
MTSHTRTVALASTLTLGFFGEALAHAHFKAATPATDGTIATAPAKLDLKFSEGVNPSFQASGCHFRHNSDIQCPVSGSNSPLLPATTA